MPRATRKRNLPNPRKAQLRFVEQPTCGSRHEYGAQTRSAINPKPFLSHPPRQAVPRQCWVSPQFTSLEDTSVRRGGPRRKTASSYLRTSTSNKTLLSTQVRRWTGCRYSALLFETPRRPRASAAPRVGELPDVRPRPEDGPVPPSNHDDLPDPAPCAGIVPEPSPRSDPVRSTIGPLAPPHIDTPEMPRPERGAPSPLRGLLFSPRTPPRAESLLVKDTPESDYGLKVTWRRRKKLMRLLAQRGQLVHSDAVITNR